LGGLSIVTIEEPGRTFTGFIAGLSITKTFERGIATIAYRHGIVAGVETGAPTKEDTLTFRYSMPVTTSLDASLSAFYNRYKSLNTEGVSVATSRTDMGGSVDASYRILPWMSATLSYAYIKSHDSLNDTGSYYNNIVMIGLRVAQQARF
jgi:predicted porin